MKKRSIVTCLIVGMAIFLIGCSPKKAASGAVSLNVGLAAAYVNEQKVEGLAAELKKGLPEYNDASKSMRVTGVSTGDSKNDPMAVMAGTTRVATMFSSGEVELWISDPENARRYGQKGKSYVPLKTLFTEQEMASFNGTPTGIAVTDDTGKETGETSEICGIDLSRNAAVRELTGLSNPQMFILVSSANKDAAKAAFRYLATKR
jgi:hypothetical protein